MVAASKAAGNGAGGTGRALVIVESPSKARTIGGFLGSNYVVDFYVPEGWDRGQPGPAVVLTQGRGGRAQQADPGYAAANAGTYLTHARLPV